MKVKNFTLLCLMLSLLVPGLVLATVHTVQMVDNDFVPQNITITEGDTVVWTNDGAVTHTTTSGTNCTGDGLWDSGNMSPNDEFTYVFSSAGTYPYFCIPHCGMGMTGEVTVQPGIGLEENEEISLKLFPNPVIDYLKLDLGNGTAKDVSIQLYDLTGTELDILELEQINEHELKVNTSALKSGMYILKFTREEEVVLVEKFQKL